MFRVSDSNSNTKEAARTSLADSYRTNLAPKTVTKASLRAEPAGRTRQHNERRVHAKEGHAEQVWRWVDEFRNIFYSRAPLSSEGTCCPQLPACGGTSQRGAAGQLPDAVLGTATVTPTSW